MKPTMNFVVGLLIVLMCPVMLRAEVQDTTSTIFFENPVYNMRKQTGIVKNEPLANKKFGVEINYPRLLMLEDAFTFSGSVSLFDVSRRAEIVFPVYFQHPKDASDLTELTMDCHYRCFLGKHQNGFYVSTFVRSAYLQGTVWNSKSTQTYAISKNRGAYLRSTSLRNTSLRSATTGTVATNTSFNTSPEMATLDPKDSEMKVGVGVGIGYRIFTQRGYYWGASVSVGQYLLGKNNRFLSNYRSLDNDDKFIYDVEFLKFGFAF